MAYKGDRVGIGQMFDELLAAGRTRYDAAVELGAALKDGAIVLEFAGQPVIEEIVPIAQCLRDFVANPNKPPEGWAVARWTVVMQKAETDREQFEKVCRLSRPDSIPSNRRFASDDELVAEGVAGIKMGRWSNPHQAAQELAPRAKGASEASSVQRLGLKIREAIRKAMN